MQWERGLGLPVEAMTRNSYAIVLQHLNSSLMNAKFSKHNDDATEDVAGSYLDMREQIKY